MDIKLIALDMDGTLLDSKKNLPPDFISWVRSHPEIMTVIASGRQYYTLENDLSMLKNELTFIAENGGLVIKNDEIIYCDEMKIEDVRRCLDIIGKYPDMTPVLCGAKSAYIPAHMEYGYSQAKPYYVRPDAVEDIYDAAEKDIIMKIAVNIKDFKAEQYMKFFDNLSEGLKPVLSGDSWIDLANASVNKGEAVKAILNRYGIDRKNAMSFGDYLNDYELIQSCEESYCMENGHPALKEIAKYTAESNDNDGVMKILRTL
ncbi:MAG: HAD family hydrolase [Lachnospiraceae bacterium]|nr:HAD family hydrolase [Lachnospiraceae bacterium]